MPFVSEIEVVFFTGTMKRNRTINEKDRFVNIVFVADFREKPICESVISCRFKLCV